jgi:hypothetical protein
MNPEPPASLNPAAQAVWRQGYEASGKEAIWRQGFDAGDAGKGKGKPLPPRPARTWRVTFHQANASRVFDLGSDQMVEILRLRQPTAYIRFLQVTTTEGGNVLFNVDNIQSIELEPPTDA